MNLKKKIAEYIFISLCLVCLGVAIRCKPIVEVQNPYLRVRFSANVLPLNDTGRLSFRASASARSSLSKINWRTEQLNTALVYGYSPNPPSLISGNDTLIGAIDSYAVSEKTPGWFPGSYRLLVWSSDLEDRVSDTSKYFFDYQNRLFPLITLNASLIQNLIVRAGDSLVWSGVASSPVGIKKTWLVISPYQAINQGFITDTLWPASANLLIQNFKFAKKIPDNLKTGQNISVYTGVEDTFGRVYRLERKLIIR